MAYEQVVEGLEWAQEAGADLSAKVHYIAKLDSSGNLVLAAAGTDSAIGVIREGAVSGRPATIQYGGIAKVICGGTIAPGDRVTSDSAGKAVATTTAGNRVLGTALMAGDANEIISVMMIPGHVATS